ncbi:MAG: hypothetical protein ACK4YU_04920 [Paracoccus sp. (in: a-proteobacteria)]
MRGAGRKNRGREMTGVGRPPPRGNNKLGTRRPTLIVNGMQRDGLCSPPPKGNIMSDTAHDTEPLASSCMRDMQTKGFSIIRGALGPEQVRQLRMTIESHFRRAGRMQYGGKIQLRALQNVRGLADTALTLDLANVVRRHVGATEPLLTGECDVMMNTTSDWHKDITADMKLGTEMYGDHDFAVYKVAIYLQDQTNGSKAALRVRPGSQVMADGSALPAERLETRAGDVVVFDVRLDHAGQPPDLATRILRLLTKPLARITGQDAEALLTRCRAVLLRGKPDRIAFFMTFGPDNYWTRMYEQAGRHRHGPGGHLLPQTSDSLRDLNLGIIEQA